MWAVVEALRAGNFVEIRSALAENQSVLREKDEHDDTLLHVAARLHVPEKILRLLVDAGADVNAANRNARRPLHEAWDSPETTSCLISLGADVNGCKRGDWSALMLAGLWSVAFQCFVDLLFLSSQARRLGKRRSVGRTWGNVGFDE